MINFDNYRKRLLTEEFNSAEIKRYRQYRLEEAADHWNHREDDDYYSQPGILFRLMTADQRKALFGNTARAMGDAPKEIKIRHIGNCLKADPAYGKGVADALGIPLSEVPKEM